MPAQGGRRPVANVYFAARAAAGVLCPADIMDHTHYAAAIAALTPRFEEAARLQLARTGRYSPLDTTEMLMQELQRRQDEEKEKCNALSDPLFNFMLWAAGVVVRALSGLPGVAGRAPGSVPAPIPRGVAAPGSAPAPVLRGVAAPGSHLAQRPTTRSAATPGGWWAYLSDIASSPVDEASVTEVLAGADPLLVFAVQAIVGRRALNRAFGVAAPDTCVRRGRGESCVRGARITGAPAPVAAPVLRGAAVPGSHLTQWHATTRHVATTPRPACQPTASASASASASGAPPSGGSVPPRRLRLVDVLPALCKAGGGGHPQLAKLVGLSRAFSHHAELLAVTAEVRALDGRTRLHVAVERSNHARAAELLAACLTLTVRRALLAPAGGTHPSPLWAASNVRVAELLLGAGADARVCDQKGVSAFSISAARGKLDVMRVLLASLGSDAERQEALASTLRFGVRRANAHCVLIQKDVRRHCVGGDGNWRANAPLTGNAMMREVVILGLGLGRLDTLPADLQEAAMPLARQSMLSCVQANAAIHELALVSPAALRAAGTLDDTRGAAKVSLTAAGDFLARTLLSPTPGPHESWVWGCVQGFQAALLALEAGAPLSTPVPARVTASVDDLSHDHQPMTAWLQAHARWFGAPLVEAALARYGRRGRVPAAAARRASDRPAVVPVPLPLAPASDAPPAKSIDELLAEIEGPRVAPAAAGSGRRSGGRGKKTAVAPAAASSVPPAAPPVTAAAVEAVPASNEPDVLPQLSAATSLSAAAGADGAESLPAAGWRPQLLAASAVEVTAHRARLAALRAAHAVELATLVRLPSARQPRGSGSSSGAPAATDASAAAAAVAEAAAVVAMRGELAAVRAAIAQATARAADEAQRRNTAAAAAVAGELAALQAHEEAHVATIRDEAAAYAARVNAHVAASVGPLEQQLASLRTAAAGLELEAAAARRAW